MNRFRLLVGGLLMSVMAVLIWTWWPDNGTRVFFFDVGQGDAILIDGPQHIDIVIDGGPDDAVLEKMSRALPFFDRKIELIVLTHPHADHLAGLLSVIERYEVGAIVEAPAKGFSSELYNEWNKRKADRGIQTIEAVAGLEFPLGAEGAFRILYPRANEAVALKDDANEFSVVARLDVGDQSVLFTGDLPGVTEQELIRDGAWLEADVLKIGHHGSKTSTTKQFLERADPDLAVISVGQHNRYGHPGQRVLDELAGHHVQVFRTDHQGDIELRIRSQGILTKVQKNDIVKK